MQGKSLIITAICSFFEKLGAFYENTLYYRFFCRIFNLINQFLGKIFEILFSANVTEKEKKESIFARTANAAFSSFYYIFGKTVKSATKKSEESFIIRIVRLIFDNWHLISVKNYATVFLAFTVVRLAIIHSAGRTNDKYSLIFLVISVVGMLIPASFSGLYQGSNLRKHIGLYEPKESSRLIIQIKPHIAASVCLVMGTLLGLSTLLPYWHIFVLCVFGIVFVFVKPNISALLITASFPFVPENIFIVLAVIVLAVWFIHYLSGENSKIRIDGLDACIIFIIITALGCVFGSPVIKSSIGSAVIFLLFSLLYFALRKSFADKTNIKLFADIMIIVAGVIAFSHLYRMAFSKTVFDKDSFSLLHSVEQNLRSTAVSGKAFGELFIFVLPLALCRMKFHRAFFGKLMYFISALLMSVCICVSYKYCIPAFIVAIVLTVFSNYRKLASVLLIPSVICVVALIFYLVLGRPYFSAFIGQNSSLFLDNKNLSMMLACGVGFGKEALKSAYASVFGQIPQNGDVMSFYTSIMLASGVAGIVVFIAAMRTVFSFIGKSMKLSKLKNPLAGAFIICAVLFVFMGFMPARTYCNMRYMVFFTISAVAGAMLDMTEQKEVH